MKIEIRKVNDIVTCGDGCCHEEALFIIVNDDEDHIFRLENEDVQEEVSDLIEFLTGFKVNDKQPNKD